MSHSFADPSAPTPPPRRGPTPVVWAAMIVVTALVVGGATWFFTSRSSSAVEATAERADAGAVTLEAFGSTGADPFVPAEPITATAPQWAASPPAPAGADPLLVDGDTPLLYGGSPTGSTALYGGSNEQRMCDPEQLVAFLAANPAKATAWASVFGRSTDEIAGFVRSLTPVVLLRDTAVTNHGFAGGAAVARPAVLQAGTAVLVDEFGVPAVRCACGNPLLPPPVTDLPSAAFVGERWAGFDPAAILSVRAAGAPLTGRRDVRGLRRPAMAAVDRAGPVRDRRQRASPHPARRPALQPGPDQLDIAGGLGAAGGPTARRVRGHHVRRRGEPGGR